MGQLQDRLNRTQGGIKSSKLNIAKNIDVRKNEGVTAFRWYNPNAKENLFTTEPIGGVFINSAMKITAFDRTMGNGATYYTSMFFKNDDIVVLWHPVTKKKIMTGVPAEIKKKLVDLNVQPKMHQILFVLNEDGLLAVKTNLPIAIDQMSQKRKAPAVGTYKEMLKNQMIILTPTEYDPSDPDITTACKKDYLPLAVDNHPKYAKISLGPALDESMLTDLDVMTVLDNFDEWVKLKNANPLIDQEDSSVPGKDDDLPPAGHFADQPPY